MATSRGNAAAATRIFRGGGSRRRRGRDVDIPWRRFAATRRRRGRDADRRRRGCDAKISQRRVAETPRPRRGDSLGMSLGDAATRTFRGDESRRRRGRDAEIPWRRVDAAAETRIVRGDESRRHRSGGVALQSRPACAQVRQGLQAELPTARSVPRGRLQPQTLERGPQDVPPAPLGPHWPPGPVVRRPPARCSRVHAMAVLGAAAQPSLSVPLCGLFVSAFDSSGGRRAGNPCGRQPACLRRPTIPARRAAQHTWCAGALARGAAILGLSRVGCALWGRLAHAVASATRPMTSWPASDSRASKMRDGAVFEHVVFRWLGRVEQGASGAENRNAG